MYFLMGTLGVTWIYYLEVLPATHKGREGGIWWDVGPHGHYMARLILANMLKKTYGVAQNH